MRIVRELAAERNPVAKIAFLTRLPEAAVRETLSLAAAADAEARERLPPTAESHITSAGAGLTLASAELAAADAIAAISAHRREDYSPPNCLHLNTDGRRLAAQEPVAP